MLVTLLLWACVLLAVPLLCITEAYYLLFGVLFFSACEGYPDSPEQTWEAMLTTILAVLNAANQPPLSAGIDFGIVDTTTRRMIIADYCVHRDTLRTSTLRMLVGAGVLVFAAIQLLVHWEKYSKAWQHSTYRDFYAGVYKDGGEGRQVLATSPNTETVVDFTSTHAATKGRDASQKNPETFEEEMYSEEKEESDVEDSEEEYSEEAYEVESNGRRGQKAKPGGRQGRKDPDDFFNI